MSKALEIAVLSLGSLSFFAVCFLGFALSAGVPMHEMAVVGDLFPSPSEEDEEDRSDPTELELLDPDLSGQGVIGNNLGFLSAWSLEPPFSGNELSELANELKSRKIEVEQREGLLEEREAQVERRMATIQEQLETLEGMRATLEAYNTELDLREAEIQRDAEAAGLSTTKNWGTVARLFEDGDAKKLTDRLLEFEPAEAAQLLRSLDDDRAKELLNALPKAQWRLYVDAYTRAAD